MRYKNSDYDIYEDGRCYSHKSNKWLKPQMTSDYPTYNLTIDGIKRKTKVHRMVAETFLPQPEGKNIVNHIDGNKKNFNLNNLEWVNEKENSQHAVNTKLMPKSNQTPIYYENDLEDEKWVPCINYPNYIISSYGRVMNINTKRLLKTCIDKKGYYYASFWKEGKGKVHQIHRIEFMSFFPEENLEGYVINHIDGIKTNNKLNNLEKSTYQENNLHAEYCIKSHKCAKAVYQLDKNRNILKSFPSIAQAERETGVTCISRAIKKNYCAGGYYWRFKNND